MFSLKYNITLELETRTRTRKHFIWQRNNTKLQIHMHITSGDPKRYIMYRWLGATKNRLVNEYLCRPFRARNNHDLLIQAWNNVTIWISLTLKERHTQPKHTVYKTNMLLIRVYVHTYPKSNLNAYILVWWINDLWILKD